MVIQLNDVDTPPGLNELPGKVPHFLSYLNVFIAVYFIYIPCFPSNW